MSRKRTNVLMHTSLVFSVLRFSFSFIQQILTSTHYVLEDEVSYYT